MTLQPWIIEPHDSLIVRDGKHFGDDTTHATSLDFPFPSTTTGGVRTRAGLDADGKFDVSRIPAVKDIEVKGALLAEIDDHSEITEFYLPSPADALLLQGANQKSKNKAQLYRLLPLQFSDAMNNLPGLLPVGLNRTDKRDKPCNDLRFWNWEVLQKWLIDGSDKIENLANYGIKNLQKDARVHVAINEDFASVEGALFQTHGIEFNYGERDLAKMRKFGLVVFVDDVNSQKLNGLNGKGNLAPLGGERRLVTWRPSKKQHQIQTCPQEIKDQIINDKHCRLMLLTPAYFESGLPQSKSDYEVKAIACERYQTVSGWDFEIKKPKPTRRLVPAGSILFLKIKNNNVDKWIESTWFSCVGDDKQATKDGFGLSVLGTWNGNPLTEWRNEDENTKN